MPVYGHIASETVLSIDGLTSRNKSMPLIFNRNTKLNCSNDPCQHISSKTT